MGYNARKHRNDTEATVKIRVVVTKEEGRYWGEVLGLPACFVSGRTPTEVRNQARKAVALYFRAAASALKTPRRASEERRFVDVAV